MGMPYVLLAEDDPDDVDILREALWQKKPEIEILCVGDGEKLITYLENCPSGAFPSLILLDYNLPLMTADQILDELSRKTRYSGIPKIVWSTADKVIFARRCLERGALEYLYKPAGVADLNNLVEKVSLVLDRYTVG